MKDQTLKDEMANAENHSYPTAGFARSSNEIPGASYEEAQMGARKAAVEQERLVGLIRGVMDDQAEVDEDKPKPKRKFRLLTRSKKPAAAQHEVPPHETPKPDSKVKSKLKVKVKTGPVEPGVVHRASSYISGALWRILKPGFTKLKSYRPPPKHIGIAVLAVIVFLRPWLIPITVLALSVLAVIVWLSLGPDRVSEFIYAQWLRLRARNPERAEKIRLRYQAAVTRINKVLSWVPGKWAKQMRLRDYSDEAQHQAEIYTLPDPFERLADDRLPQQGEG